MKRRHFLACAAAMGGVAIAGPAVAFVDYTPGVIEQALADGRTVMVDYAADWCSTCARQERVINALREANPAYDAAMLFVRVDWDTYRRDAVATDRAIPRRSTLIVLRGDAELGRIVAGTGEAEIQALLDLGLSGA